MNKAILVRRLGWGVDFSKVVKLLSTKITPVRCDKLAGFNKEGVTHLIYWGYHGSNVEGNFEHINTPNAITSSSNKRKFRLKMREQYPDLIPPTWGADEFTHMEEGKSYIVRPPRHMQGKDLLHCTTPGQLRVALRTWGDVGYVSEYIPKVAEYRAYVVDGRIFAISKKEVEDTEAIAWNHSAGGCGFVNVRWGDWPLRVADAAIKAMEVAQLDFGGVDIMVDGEGRPYVLEVNSALALPPLQDEGKPLIERISYHQRAMVKCLEWLVDGKDSAYNYQGRKENSYHHYIHAAMKDHGEY